MFLTRNVTADIISTFTAHLTAATNNFASDARFLQRCHKIRGLAFAKKMRLTHKEINDPDFGSRAPALFVEITVHLSAPLSRPVRLTCRSQRAETSQNGLPVNGIILQPPL